MNPAADAESDPKAAERRRRLAIVPAAAAIAIWRVWMLPLDRLWRDWLLLLALFAVTTAFSWKSPSRPGLTAAVMAFLLGIYLQGQLPHVLAVLGWAR